MLCPRCGGKPTGERLLSVDPFVTEPWKCPTCQGTGRVERQPLSQEEIAALRCGAPVIVARRDSGNVVAGEIAADRGAPCLMLRYKRRRILVALGARDRAWLAEDADG